jgi:hypothetical protein
MHPSATEGKQSFSWGSLSGSFHFVLDVAFCFVVAEFFFVVVEEEFDFESACFVPALEEAA